MTWRGFLGLCLVLLATADAAGCGGGGANAPASAPATATAPAVIPTDTPTVVPTDTPTAAPTDTPTVAPTDTPVATPTEAPAAPTDPPPERAQVQFVWAAGGVPPSDSDDVDDISFEVTQHQGIVDAFGNEIGISIKYDPALITIEEIQDVFKKIGHPVDVKE